MSTEAFDRIMKEVKALTPEERRQLIDKLANEEQHSQASSLSNSTTLDEEITAEPSALGRWLIKARHMRAGLPLTSDSVNILRELREARSRQ